MKWDQSSIHSTSDRLYPGLWNLALNRLGGFRHNHAKEWMTRLDPPSLLRTRMQTFRHTVYQDTVDVTYSRATSIAYTLLSSLQIQSAAKRNLCSSAVCCQFYVMSNKSPRVSNAVPNRKCVWHFDTLDVCKNQQDRDYIR